MGIWPGRPVRGLYPSIFQTFETVAFRAVPQTTDLAEEWLQGKRLCPGGGIP